MSKAELVQRFQQLSMVVIASLERAVPEADDATVATVLGIVVGSYCLVADDRGAYLAAFQDALDIMIGDGGERVMKAMPVAGNG